MSKIDLNDLTIGQARALAAQFSITEEQTPAVNAQPTVDSYLLGKIVLVRTYSAGVWTGVLEQKSKDEVILTKARRMYQWWCVEGISLSSIVIHGINQGKSRIAAPVDLQWLQAIEIMPYNNAAAAVSVMDAPIATA